MRKLNQAQIVIAEMIELDLQQAWQLLDASDFDLAEHHLDEAKKKVTQMRDAAEPAKGAPKQLTIDV